MAGLILRTLIIALGIWLAAFLVPGVSAASTGALIWAAIALGLINAFVRPVLVLLTLPFTILTLGALRSLGHPKGQLATRPGYHPSNRPPSAKSQTKYTYARQS
jgi:hypothetical protein